MAARRCSPAHLLEAVPDAKWPPSMPKLPWTGPPVTSFDDTLAGRPCQTVPVAREAQAVWAPLATAALDHFGMTYSDGEATGVVRVRPLLPHEKSCADAAEWRKVASA